MHKILPVLNPLLGCVIYIYIVLLCGNIIMSVKNYKFKK